MESLESSHLLPLLLLLPAATATTTAWSWVATSAFAPSQSELVAGLTQNANATGRVVTNGVAVDSDGNTFVCGAFSGSVDFAGGTSVGDAPTTDGFRHARGASDAFLVRFSASGEFSWVEAFGGTGRGVRLAASGENDPVLGGLLSDAAHGAVVHTGDTFVTVAGIYEGDDVSLGGGGATYGEAPAPSPAGKVSSFVSTFWNDNSGGFVWSKALSTAGADAPGHVVATAVIAQHGTDYLPHPLLVVGALSGGGGAGAPQLGGLRAEAGTGHAAGEDFDAFVARFRWCCSQNWHDLNEALGDAFAFGGNGTQVATAIAAHSANPNSGATLSLHVGGFFRGALATGGVGGAPAVSLTAAAPPAGAASAASRAVDGFVATFAAATGGTGLKYEGALAGDGDAAAAYALGGPGVDAVAGVGVDAGGNVFAALNFDAARGLSQPAALAAGATAHANGGPRAALLYSASGAGYHRWHRRIGGGADAAGAAAVAGGLVVTSGIVYITGLFTGAVSVGSREAADTAALLAAGGSDAFVAKYTSDARGDLAWALRVGGRSEDGGASIAVGGDEYDGIEIRVAGHFTREARFDCLGKCKVNGFFVEGPTTKAECDAEGIVNGMCCLDTEWAPATRNALLPGADDAGALPASVRNNVQQLWLGAVDTANVAAASTLEDCSSQCPAAPDAASASGADAACAGRGTCDAASGWACACEDEVPGGASCTDTSTVAAAADRWARAGVSPAPPNAETLQVTLFEASYDDPALPYAKRWSALERTGVAAARAALRDHVSDAGGDASAASLPGHERARVLAALAPLVDAVRGALAAHARVPVAALVPLVYELTVDYVDGHEARVDVTDLYLGDGLGFRHDAAHLRVANASRDALLALAPDPLPSADYVAWRRREMVEFVVVPQPGILAADVVDGVSEAAKAGHVLGLLYLEHYPSGAAGTPEGGARLIADNSLPGTKTRWQVPKADWSPTMHAEERAMYKVVTLSLLGSLLLVLLCTVGCFFGFGGPCPRSGFESETVVSDENMSPNRHDHDDADGSPKKDGDDGEGDGEDVGSGRTPRSDDEFRGSEEGSDFGGGGGEDSRGKEPPPPPPPLVPM